MEPSRGEILSQTIRQRVEQRVVGQFGNRLIEVPDSLGRDRPTERHGCEAARP